MGSMIEILDAGVTGEFFAPAPTDMIDNLCGQYRAMRKRIEEVAETVLKENVSVVGYFLEGNADTDRRHSMPSVERLFEVKGAVAALNSTYWSKTMQLTDVLNYMPQARRTEWHEQIRNQTCPDFEDETVRATIGGLLAMRAHFLAERVDGIFRGLSGEHVTNSPAAFGKRMIVGHVLRRESRDWWSENSHQCGLINDLRCVIAKFMGRDEPTYQESSHLVARLKGSWGTWFSVDGGAFRIRLYMVGTAHIEVHPDMAWRLNAVLASLYPLAIPAEFRQRPKRKVKEVPLMMQPLPFAVINLLVHTKQAYRHEKTNDFRNPFRRIEIRNAVEMHRHYTAEAEIDKHAVAKAEAVLESIGGVKAKEGHFQFDYPPFEVLDEIITSGCVPDDKSHQFYPTQHELAARAVEFAEIGPNDECLEPSAGTGGIADLMPIGRTTCVEVSDLRCEVLEAKGHRVVRGDFMQFSSGTFDRIVLNPPFDQGRWRAHVERAAEMLAPAGRLVAILPASARTSGVLPDMALQWRGPFDNQFPGTSVSVVILIAQRTE